MHWHLTPQCLILSLVMDNDHYLYKPSQQPQGDRKKNTKLREMKLTCLLTQLESGSTGI